jgi:arylformamidase
VAPTRIKNIIDISRKIHMGMTVWPGDKNVKIERDSAIENGDYVNTSSMNLSLHTGTHVDAPLHFIDGALDVCSVDLRKFMGFVKLFELNVNERITRGDIKDLPINEGDSVFFKTSNSNLSLKEPFNPEYIYMDIGAGVLLVEKKVKAVGVDYLSVDGFKCGSGDVHKLFLSNNIALIEGLCFKNVTPGKYFYSCLPLCIDNGDGSPVRAVLAEFEE